MSRMTMSGAAMYHHFVGDGRMTLKVCELAPPGVEATLSLQGRGEIFWMELSREAVVELASMLDTLFALDRRPRENRMQLQVGCVKGRTLLAIYLCNGARRGITFADAGAPESGVHLEAEELFQFVSVLCRLVGRQQASTESAYVELPAVADAVAEVAVNAPARARADSPGTPWAVLALGPAAFAVYLLSIFNQGWVPEAWKAQMSDGLGGFAYAVGAGMIAAKLTQRSWKTWQARRARA